MLLRFLCLIFSLFALFKTYYCSGTEQDVCTIFVVRYDGKFKFPNWISANDDTDSDGYHNISAKMDFFMKKKTIYAKLIESSLGDQSYTARLTVVYREKDATGDDRYVKIEQCRGFVRDGKDDCTIEGSRPMKEYKFELCLSTMDTCEEFFHAYINDKDYFYPPTDFTEKGNQWKEAQCSSGITFSDGTQPPRMDYCVCCDADNEDEHNVCPGNNNKPAKTSSTTVLQTTTTSVTKKPNATAKTTSHTTTIPNTTPTGKVEETKEELDNCTKNSTITGLKKVFCEKIPLDTTNVGGYIQDTSTHLNETTADYRDVYWLSHICLNISNVKNMNEEDSAKFFQLYDKMLWIDEKHFYQINADIDNSTSNRILQSIHQFLSFSDKNLEYLDASNLAMLKYQDLNLCSQSSITLSDNGDSFGKSLDSAKSSIQIPTNVLCSNGQQMKPTFLVAYRKTQLFLPIRDKKKIENGGTKSGLNSLHQFLRLTEKDDPEITMDTPRNNDRCRVDLYSEHHPVLTATIVGENDKHTNGKQVKARLRYSAKNLKPVLHGSRTVSWWSNESNTWMENSKCKTRKDGNFYYADCYHLTDFTLLIDASPTDPILCNNVLKILGLVLVIGSSFGLLCIMIIQFLNLSKSARRCASSFFRVFPFLRFRVELVSFVYTTMLFLFYTFFAIFSDQAVAVTKTRCSIFAALSYFLLLCCILLTIFQAWRILKIFSWSSEMENSLKFVTKNPVVIVSSFVIPLIIALGGFFIDNDLYERNDNFCWINATDISWAIIVPISILIVNGFFCMFVVVARLYPKLRCLTPIRRWVRTDSKVLTKGQRVQARDKFLAILNMQFLLGLPWALQYLTLFSRRATMWHYLFTVVNGSQGIILFVFFIYRRIRGRKTDATTLSSPVDTQDTNQRTLTMNRADETTSDEQQTPWSRSPQTGVKHRHQAVKSVQSLPAIHGNIYENEDYESTQHRLPQIYDDPHQENTNRQSRLPQQSNQPKTLTSKMYIY